jgi:DNA mismatch endonuclease (patch repair protein)
MRIQPSKNTRPEMRLRRALHARGLRFRIHRAVVPGTRREIDIVFGPSKVAVDVRGCYWHGHLHEFAAYQRRVNLDYWGPKIDGNRVRDADTEARLEANGWRIIVVWECQDVADVVTSIESAVLERQPRTAVKDGRVPAGRRLSVRREAAGTSPTTPTRDRVAGRQIGPSL